MNGEILQNAGSIQWFALRVKSNCEKTVAAIVHNKGFEVFLPLYIVRNRWSDRVKTLEVPLFPGYVFCHIDAKVRLSVLTIPGALEFIGIAKIPSPIEDAEIANIRDAVRSGLPALPWEYMDAGQLVRVNEGSLAGCEGILIKTCNNYRIVVSVKLLKRSIAVEIDRNSVTALDLDRRPIAIPASKAAIHTSED